MTENIADAYRRHAGEYDNLYRRIEEFHEEWTEGEFRYTVTAFAEGTDVFVRIDEEWDGGLHVLCIGYDSLAAFIGALTRAKAHLGQPATTPAPPVPPQAASPSTPQPTGAGR